MFGPWILIQSTLGFFRIMNHSTQRVYKQRAKDFERFGVPSQTNRKPSKRLLRHVKNCILCFITLWSWKLGLEFECQYQYLLKNLVSWFSINPGETSVTPTSEVSAFTEHFINKAVTQQGQLRGQKVKSNLPSSDKNRSIFISMPHLTAHFKSSFPVIHNSHLINHILGKTLLDISPLTKSKEVWSYFFFL